MLLRFVDGDSSLVSKNLLSRFCVINSNSELIHSSHRIESLFQGSYFFIFVKELEELLKPALEANQVQASRKDLMHVSGTFCGETFVGSVSLSVHSTFLKDLRDS